MGKRVNLADLAIDDELVVPSARRANAGHPDTAVPNRVVPIRTVALNPLNKRPPGEPDDEISQMAETIRQHGVIQPLVVCSTEAYLAKFPNQREAVDDARWVVLIGNRRLRAALAAPLDEVPIIINDDQVTSMYEVMLVENGQRRDLPPVLEAEAMKEVLAAGAISQRELARRIGKSHMYITQRLALLKLIPKLRAALENGELTIERARELGELPRSEQQAIAAAGKPYRKLREASKSAEAARTRNIRVSTPAAAAESIRKLFSEAELTELIQLLSRDLADR